jgi:hypothetical protein
MPLADDVSILRRPIGFAVGINREEEIDRDKQRQRLPGLLRFVRTFAGQVLEQEFGTRIEGYPDQARAKTSDLRVSLRDLGAASAPARAFLTVLIDLMDLEADHDEASPENDPEEQEDFHDAILTFIERLLGRFAGYAESAGRLPAVAEEARRGHREFAQAAERLAR